MKSILVIVMFIFLIPLSYSSNGIWTYAEDIRPGIFGADESNSLNSNYTFNDYVYFNKNVFGNSNLSINGDILGSRFMDLDDSNFFVNPSGVSGINRIVANRYFSYDPNFYLNPAGSSVINNVEIQGELIINDQNITDLIASLNDGGSFSGNNLDMKGGNIINTSQVHTNELCDQNGENCINLSDASDFSSLTSYVNDCYNPNNIGEIGAEGTVCEGMLIVDNDMIRGVGSSVMNSNIGCLVGGNEQFKLLGPDGNWYTFAYSQRNIFTGQVTDMSCLFSGTDFNEDINYWDTSNVEDMYRMFSGATEFNQPLDKWDVSNVENMERMFASAWDYKRALTCWNVEHIPSRPSGFSASANSELEEPLWGTSGESGYWWECDPEPPYCLDSKNVGRIGEEGVCEGMLIVDELMLRESIDNHTYTYSFIGPDGNQYTFSDSQRNIFTGQVTDMSSLFLGEYFNQDIGYWNTTFVRDMRSMFKGTISSGYHPFNQNISNWDVGNVEDMDTMFAFAPNFNQNLSCWDVSAVEVHYGSPIAFDSGADSWDESNKPNFETGGGC